MSAALLTKLISAGTPADLVAEVAMELAKAKAAIEALETRRKHERDRKAKSRDITGQGVTSCDIPEKVSLDKKVSQTLPKIKPIQTSPFIPQTVEAWNSMAAKHGLPQVEGITGKRQKALMARIGEHGFDAVLRAISSVPNSPHWLGANGWLGNLDSLLRPDNFQRMLEGVYAGKPERPKAPDREWTVEELRNAIRFRRDAGDDEMAAKYEAELERKLAA